MAAVQLHRVALPVKTSRSFTESSISAQNNEIGINNYLREIGRIPLLTPQQEVELATEIRNGNQKARALMINSNLRLVVTIAQDYANLGLPLLDIVSEGNIGLMEAVDRFDPSKGAKLSTYAAWWIRQSIRRALSNHSKTIRLPVRLGQKIAKVRRIALRMSEEISREPTDDELGEEIGLASESVSYLKTVSIRPASLDAPVGQEDSTEFGETVRDEQARTPFELLREKDLHNDFSGLLEVLEDREKEIISQRFGFDGGGRRTFGEIGKELGLSRERVRQLQNNALSKLRCALSQKDALDGLILLPSLPEA